MSICCKYAPYGTNIVVLYYVDDCVYWYTSEALVKWFVDTLGERFHMKFLGYAHWFMSIGIYQIKDHSIKYIWIYMLLLLWISIWILPQLRKVQSFMRPLFHLIWYFPKLMHIPVIIKLISWRDNSIFTTEFLLDRWFIISLEE